MSKLGETLKDLAPGLIGGAVGAISPQAGQSLTNAISMADAFKHRRRTRAIEDERLIRERAKFEDYEGDREFTESERERSVSARDALIERAPEGTLERDFATYAPGQWAAGEVAAGRANEVRLQGVMDEETFALKKAEINDPDSDQFGIRITAKVRDKDGNVATRYAVPEHMQGSQTDPDSLTKKDKYRLQGDYSSALGDIRSVFRETDAVRNMRQGLKDRPTLLTPEAMEGMLPNELAKAQQEEWQYMSQARASLLDRERKNQALLDDALNRALAAGAMLGQTPEETYAQISKATGLDIAPGYDPYADEAPGGGVGSGDGASLAQAFMGDDAKDDQL